MALAHPVRDTTLVFTITGEEIQKSIQTRVARHEGEINKCLDEISSMLAKKSEDFNTLAQNAASLMLVLADKEHLAVEALVVKAQLQRASSLTSERIDLLCIARNLDQKIYYKVNLQEAKRYGLV